MVVEFNDFITGERIQQCADIYIGNSSDFNWNPVIAHQPDKHKYISDFTSGEPYNNPGVVFCYSHLLASFADYLDLFQNPFILVSHNSDENIRDTPHVRRILNHPRLARWYAQNICLPLPTVSKLYMLPIGIANLQWPHGNLYKLQQVISRDYHKPKTQAIYMSFKIETQVELRERCYRSLYRVIPFLPPVDFESNLRRMVTYKYCICPEGNGVDTHRLWEALYLGVVPIMVENAFTKNVRDMGFPCVLVASWETWDISSLDLTHDYTEDFAKTAQMLSIQYYK
jgi:hypothetical protein